MSLDNPSREEQEWMEDVADAGCIVCYLYRHIVRGPACVHHLLRAGRRISHLLTIGLCHQHHQGNLNTPELVSRHPYKAEFERRYGDEFTLLCHQRVLIAKRRELVICR